MGSANWNTVFTGTSSYAIQSGAPPSGTQWMRILAQAGGFRGAFFYKDKVDFADCQLKCYQKTVAQPIYSGVGVRFNRSTGTGYFVGLFQNNATTKGVYMYKMSSWGVGGILASGTFASNLGVWEQYRIRCWDIYVPGWRVRFTVERYTGGAWVTLWTYDDTSPSIANGELGFGSMQADYTGSTDWDLVELFTMSP